MTELEKLYNEQAKRIYNYILSLSGNPHIAEEVLQDTFYRATKHVLISNKILQPAWFFKVARNIYIDFQRGKSRSENLADFEMEIGNDDSLETILEVKELQLTVQEVLMKLPENYRTILILREFQELTYQDISEIMGISMDNVKVGLFRARQKFKHLYKRRDLD